MYAILKIGENMKNLSRKTFNIMISTIITIAINLILMGIVAYKEKKVCIDSNGFETACHITTIDQIINVMFPIILLVMIVLGVILIIKSKKEKSKLVLLVGLVSISLSISYIACDIIKASNKQNGIHLDKPVLYLYPEQQENVTIRFEHPENLLTTYPEYKTEWRVTANSDGSLYDKDNKYYYALYWDEKNTSEVNFDEGFYVTKENAIEFLETTLTKIGLTRREQNEFIMYWLPILEKNEKSLVNYTLTEKRQEENELIITPKPDSLLRVAINIKKEDKKVKIKKQTLPTFTRKGFTAIEWGGCIYN